MSDFKFTKYAYQPDPEFDDYDFIKFEELKNQIITINTDHIRLKEDSVKMVVNMDGKDYCTFTKSKAIVNTLNNIMTAEGCIPNVPVMIGTYPTPLGKEGYCFKDVE